MMSHVAGLTQDVEAPHLSQPRISLLTSAKIVSDTSRWENGYTFVPEGCARGAMFNSTCANANGAIDPMYVPVLKDAYRPPTQGDSPSTPVITPFIVYTSVSRNTVAVEDRTPSKLFERAERDLSIVTSYFLEQELWDDTAGLGNPALSTSVATTVTGGSTPTKALAALETAIGTCKSGGNMMIHMRPYILTQLLAAQVVRRVGNVYLSPMDNIVVPGRGYAGTGPAGQAVAATEWIYASPEVHVRLGEMVYVPEKTDDAEVLRRAVDRTTNDVTVYVERFASATFDPECCLLAIEVTT